jgi:hypothetical protein
MLSSDPFASAFRKMEPGPEDLDGHASLIIYDIWVY